MAGSRITRDGMFEPLLEADPSFRPLWNEFLAEWGDEEEPMIYIALGSLARHVLKCLEAGRTERFDAIFGVVERWHTDGDDDVRRAATVGLLEDLLPGGRDRTTVTFEPWLGPESKRWWDKLERFWYGDGKVLSSED